MFSLQSVTDLSATDRSPASLLPFPVYLAAVISQAWSKDNHYEQPELLCHAEEHSETDTSI